MLCHLANFLGNRFVGRYHLPLVGLAGIRLALLIGLIALRRESLLDFRKVIEQVKTVYMGADRDHAIRSETINDVYAAQYAVPGGDSIDASGLLMELESALSPFKDWSAG